MARRAMAWRDGAVARGAENELAKLTPEAVLPCRTRCARAWRRCSAAALLGGFILDGLKSLGKMAADAAAGALHEMLGAFREIGTKLGEFADELLSKFGGKTAENDAAHTLGNDAAHTAENDAARDAGAANDGKPRDGDGNARDGDGAGDSAAKKEAQKAEELAEAIEISKSIAAAEDAGHIPGPAIAMSLDPLEGRYTWIKAYEARPAGADFEIFLIASEHFVWRTSWRPGPNDLDWRSTGKTYRDALDEAFRRTGVPKDEFQITKWPKSIDGKSFPVEWPRTEPR